MRNGRRANHRLFAAQGAFEDLGKCPLGNPVALLLGIQKTQALSITPNTVKSHLASIMEKLHLRNRIEAAVYAVTEGLAQAPSKDH